MVYEIIRRVVAEGDFFLFGVMFEEVLIGIMIFAEAIIRRLV
jgi:hypothetical protein